MSKNSHKPKNLNVLSIPELKEILNRQNGLLRNRKIISHLADRGESIIRFKGEVEAVLTQKENELFIETEFGNISLAGKDDHLTETCEMEVCSEERFQPSSSLKKQKILRPDSVMYKIVENCHFPVFRTKFVPISESIALWRQYDERMQNGIFALAKLSLNETDEELISEDDEI